MEASISISKIEKEEREAVKRYNKPNAREHIKYNKHFWWKYHQIILDPKEEEKNKKERTTQLEAIKIALLDAAEHTLTESETEKAKPYISSDTWQLIEDRNEKVKQKKA